MKCVVVLLLVALCECASGSWESPRCPALPFPNGRVRARSKGKIVRFSCYEGYTLVGNKYSTCIRGRWDTPIPVCVNSLCPTLPTPDHSLVASKYNGAILMYFCEPGYVLVGAAEIFCNGRKWNASAPYCRDSTAAAPLSCDFEKPDLCWWEQDPTHDFDWQRHNHDTPSSHIGTGPSHDHTMGAGYDGYYLYIEASGRLVNDTARIISPLYNASLTDYGCFSFWYHMYGATIGALKVYLKPENAASQLMFEKEGNQGNRWIHGYFSLPTVNTSFQIIIEGIRGTSYVSDMAIDDVAILQGEQCEFAGTTIAPEAIPTNEDQIELVNFLQSCRGRCGSGPPSPDAATTIIPFNASDACHCTYDCADTSICCADFAEYCILGVSDLTTGGTSHQTARPTTTKTPSIPKKPIPINPKDDIDPYAKATEISTTSHISITTRTIPKVETIPATMRTTFIVKTTKFPVAKPTKPATKVTTAMPTKAAKKATTIHAETPFSSVTGTRDDPNLSSRTEAHVRAEQATIQQIDSPISLGASGIAAIVVVIASAIVLTTIITFVLLRKRKSYKRGAGGSASALSEDSDVRFLTSDEILDFNIARPTEYDE